MILEKLIQQKARDIQLKTRRGLLGNLIVVSMVAALCSFGIKVLPAVRVPLLIVIVWNVVGLYFLNRGMWARPMPGDAALSTGLEFYRQEIKRRHHLLTSVLLWGFGPIVLAVAAFLFAVAKMGQLQNAQPVTALFVIWMAAFFFIRIREQRDLRREASLLDEIEAVNSK